MDGAVKGRKSDTKLRKNGSDSTEPARRKGLPIIGRPFLFGSRKEKRRHIEFTVCEKNDFFLVIIDSIAKKKPLSAKLGAFLIFFML